MTMIFCHDDYKKNFKAPSFEIFAEKFLTTHS